MVAQEKRKLSSSGEGAHDPQQGPVKRPKSSHRVAKKAPVTKREQRLAAKEVLEARKKKRKPYYSLEKELALLWERMRGSSVKKEEKEKLISEALRMMTGKMLEIANYHVSARVLQTCVKYCSQAERDIIYEELKPHLLALSRNKYAVHLVKKLLDNGSKKQLDGFISSLHGHVASLLRHSVGSAVVEHAFNLGNASQKQSLLLEMYSSEFQLFKDLTRTNSGRLINIIAKLGLQKSSVFQHMTSIIQPLLEKGIVDHSIVHIALVEYFTIADEFSATDVIHLLIPLLTRDQSPDYESQQLPSTQLEKNRKKRQSKMPVPLIVRMVRSRDGLKIAILCFKHGSAKERKKIIKCIKEHIRTVALNQYGSLLLVTILRLVDDTKLATKIIIRGMQKILKELLTSKDGRRLLLDLLHPHCSRYFSLQDFACLSLTVPSLCSQNDENRESSENVECNNQPGVESKKDSTLRRHELLVESGLAENLLSISIENADELLRSNFSREILFELAVGGSNRILQPLDEKVVLLHNAIASLGARPKIDGSEHIFENFHSSRTIKKLVINCPSFASTLWSKALQGKCQVWAKGHSCKVVSAFAESSDPGVLQMTKSEIQPLIDEGLLVVPAKTPHA